MAAAAKAAKPFVVHLKAGKDKHDVNLPKGSQTTLGELENKVEHIFGIPAQDRSTRLVHKATVLRSAATKAYNEVRSGLVITGDSSKAPQSPSGVPLSRLAVRNGAKITVLGARSDSLLRSRCQEWLALKLRPAQETKQEQELTIQLVDLDDHLTNMEPHIALIERQLASVYAEAEVGSGKASSASASDSLQEVTSWWKLCVLCREASTKTLLALDNLTSDTCSPQVVSLRKALVKRFIHFGDRFMVHEKAMHKLHEQYTKQDAATAEASSSSSSSQANTAVGAGRL